MKSSKQLVVALISIILLFGCAKTPNADVNKPPQQIPVQTNDYPTADTSKCPTRNDVKELNIAFETVISEVNLVAKEAAKQNGSERLKEQITACRIKIKDLKAKDESFISDCEMLLGADGTPVFPEIPVSFQTLTLCGKWLDKSLDAIELGN